MHADALDTTKQLAEFTDKHVLAFDWASINFANRCSKLKAGCCINICGDGIG